MVAAACVVPAGVDVSAIKVRDSKQMSEEQRDAAFAQLTTHPKISWAAAVVDNDVIDEINILQATMLAMRQAVAALRERPDYVLIDGNRCPPELNHAKQCEAEAVVKGDSKIFSARERCAQHPPKAQRRQLCLAAGGRCL